jgi:ubiquinone/menaquinone biosynthesis C-methylase UbiE
VREQGRSGQEMTESKVIRAIRRGNQAAIRAYAEDLPLRDDAVDAAMAILTVHHWDRARERGVRELRRVARGPVVILTYDAAAGGERRAGSRA